MRRVATTVYHSRAGFFPPATFTNSRSEADYIRSLQSEYKGEFGICVCPANSFEMHQVDVVPISETSQTTNVNY